MADAAHLLSDCVSFIVAIIAIWWARKPSDDRMSFGYKRLGKLRRIVKEILAFFIKKVFVSFSSEVFGAVISILGIWLLTTILFYFAIDRLLNNNFDIDADTMMIVSAIGVAINIV